MPTSGYTDCACRDCFEIAVSDDTDVPAMCCECEDAGCEADSECRVERAAFNEDDDDDHPFDADGRL